MKRFILQAVLLLTTFAGSSADQFDTSKIAYSLSHNYKNPSFEKRTNLYSFVLDYITLSYEKWDTLGSKSNIVFRKVLFDTIQPEVLITNDNFLNTNPVASHTMILWQSNKNSNLDLFFSTYDGANWSSPQVLQATPSYEMNPGLAEYKDSNNPPAYYITYQRDGDIYLKTFTNGNFILDTNLTSSVTEGCTNPVIRIFENKIYVSYLKSAGNLQRIIITKANVNTDYSLSNITATEIFHAKTVSGLSYSDGFATFPSVNGFLNFNYDTLGSTNTLGINLGNYSDKNIFTENVTGKNINGIGSLLPIVTDNSSSSYYFTLFGWNRISNDSSMIVAIGHFNFSLQSKTESFYLGDSAATSTFDISNYFPRPNQNKFRFRLVWEKKVSNRMVLYEARYDDYLSSAVSQNSNAADYRLSQNYPNPFNPATVINYELGVKNFISLKIYDILGKEIETLVNSEQEAGSHSVIWDAGNFPGGIYFYEIKTNNFSETKKMILLR